MGVTAESLQDTSMDLSVYVSDQYRKIKKACNYLSSQWVSSYVNGPRYYDDDDDNSGSGTP